MLRIPHCVDIDDGKVVSPKHRPHFTPQKHYFLDFRYSFLLERECGAGPFTNRTVSYPRRHNKEFMGPVSVQNADSREHSNEY
jgi:hypothetical protein